MNEEEIKKQQEESNKAIEEIINNMNKACEELSSADALQHLMIVGYVDTGVARGFVSSNFGLDHLESQATFLLDYTSKNIKDSVRKEALRKQKELEELIKKEEEKNNVEEGKE